MRSLSRAYLVAPGDIGHHSSSPRLNGNRSNGRARRLPQREQRVRKRIGSSRLSGPNRATKTSASIGVSRPQLAHSK